MVPCRDDGCPLCARMYLFLFVPHTLHVSGVGTTIASGGAGRPDGALVSARPTMQQLGIGIAPQRVPSALELRQVGGAVASPGGVMTLM